MDSWGQPDVQHAAITLIGLNTLVFTIGQIVIYSLVESLCEFLNAFAFKVYQPVTKGSGTFVSWKRDVPKDEPKDVRKDVRKDVLKERLVRD